MGAIVSHKKAPVNTSAQQKAMVVAAFDTRDKTSGNPQQTSASQYKSSEQAVTEIPQGEGIVGPPAHPLPDREPVTSRQEHAASKQASSEDLKQSDLYTELAQVKQVSPTEVAAIRIQSSYRGYQARQELEKERQACISIQRKFREFRVRRGDSVHSNPHITSDDDATDEEEEQTEKKKPHCRPWRESTTTTAVLDKDVKIGEKTKESFEQYQDDITDLKWQTEQQLEMSLMGDNYTPQRVVLVASNVPRADVLAEIIHKDVIKICYDFTKSSLQDLTDEISQRLEQHKPNSKAQSIGLVCKGGPGFFNPVKGKVVTKAKSKKDQELNSFWQVVGRHMSKLDPKSSTVHIIGNNVTGNKKGEKLLKFLSKTMKPSKVMVESPLELSQKGGEMLQLYFDLGKYKIWKSKMHSRVSFVV